MKTKIINTSRGRRKVRVLSNGQYRFMKTTKKKRKAVRHHIKRTRKRKTRRTRRRTYKRKAKRKASTGGLFY